MKNAHYDRFWYDAYWYDKDWYDKNWYNKAWFDEFWFDKDWWDKYWIHRRTWTKYNIEWYDKEWLEKNWNRGKLPKNNERKFSNWVYNYYGGYNDNSEDYFPTDTEDDDFDIEAWE